MALIFADSFDHYATADILTKWTTLNDSSNAAGGGVHVTIGSSNGRTKNGLQVQVASVNSAYVRYTTSARSCCIVGFAYKVNSPPTSEVGVVSFWDGSTLQITVKLQSDGTLKVYRGNSTLLGTTSSAVPSNAFIYIEVFARFKSSISLGDFIIRFNQVSVLSLAAGTNTQQTANSTATSFSVGQTDQVGSTASTHTFDDLYFCDDSGSLCNTFLGDVTVDACFPSTNGNYQDFSLSGAATSLLCVGEHAPDYGTTYVFSNTLITRESFTYGATSFSINTVFGVQTVTMSEKVGSGTRNATPFVRIGITNYENTAIAVSTSFLYQLSVYMTNPSTGVAWTSSDITALEAGVKVS